MFNRDDKDSQLIRRARSLYNRRRFGEAIRILEPEVYRYRENFTFYSLIGLCCIRTGDIGGGYTYLRKAEQIRPREPSVLLSIAAIEYRRGETEIAIEKYLDVLDQEPNNAVALRALSRVRAEVHADRSGSASSSRLHIAKLLPRLRFYIPRWLILVSIVVGVSSLVISFTTNWWSEIYSEGVRQEIMKIDLPGPTPSFVEEELGNLFSLSDSEIVIIFDTAKKYLIDYRDNLAQIEINKILLSNAKVVVKEKARRLQGFIKEPDFSNYSYENVEFIQALEKPRLYNGVYILWQGLVANLIVADNAITFDMLVGYQDRNVLEGRVVVEIDFASLISNGDAIELLGQIILQEGELLIRGISLREIES